MSVLSYEVWAAGARQGVTTVEAEVPALQAAARDANPGATPSLTITSGDWAEREAVAIIGDWLPNLADTRSVTDLVAEGVRRGYEIRDGVSA